MDPDVLWPVVVATEELDSCFDVMHSLPVHVSVKECELLKSDD